jgi:predicted RND superfamily exporter protein
MPTISPGESSQNLSLFKGCSEGCMWDFIVHRLMKLTSKYWSAGIAITVMLAAGGFFTARVLSLDTNIKNLLPAQSETVQNLDFIEKKVGSNYDFRLVIEGGSFKQKLEAAEAFSSRLDKQDDLIKSVSYKTGKGFLEKGKFQILPIPLIDALFDELDELSKKESDSLDPFGLEKKLDEGKKKEQKEASKAKAKSAWGILSQIDGMNPYQQTKDEKFLGMLVRPYMEGLNIEKNRALHNQFNQIIADFDFTRFHPDMKTHVFGSIPYQIAKYDQIMADVSFGVLIACLIIFIVVFYFRSLSSLIVILPPLLTGIGSGLALVSFFEQKLNIMSAFLGLVIFGLGIEFGIHLWSRMLEQLHEKKKSGAAVNKAVLLSCLEETWHTTGRATLASLFALMSGFGILTLSSLKGFSQFGFIAMTLVAMTGLCFLLLMPSWILLLNQIQKKQKWRLPLPKVFMHSMELKGISFHKGSHLMRLFSGILFVASLIICAVALNFDYQFDDGSVPYKIGVTKEIREEIFPERIWPAAVAVFKSESDSAQFIDYYWQEKNKFPSIPLITGLSTFLPADQEKRIFLLQDLAAELEPSIIKKAEDKNLREAMLELKEKADTLAPIKEEDIVPHMLKSFEANDGSGDFLVYLFDDKENPDDRKAIAFSEEAKTILKNSRISGHLGGSQMVFGDIIQRVISEGPWLIFGMFMLVMLICWFDFRRVWDVLLTVAPVVMGVSLTGMVIVLAGGKINFFNLIAFISLGAAVVDNSLHMYHRFVQANKNGEKNIIQGVIYTVAPPVLVCTLTSICGYGGMLAADHSGIHSLGFVAAVGLICCFISTVIFFPAWLEWALVRREAKKAVINS